MRRHRWSGLLSAIALGSNEFRNVLVSDWPQESFDRASADRGAARVGGGGVRAAVHHGVTNLDAGWPAVEQNATGLEFEDRQQCAGGVIVGFVGVHGRGQLALDVLGDGTHLGGVGTAHDQAGGSEHLGLKLLRREEAGGVGGKQSGAARGLAVVGLAAADEVGFSAECGDAVGVAVGNVRREHRGGRRLGDGVARGGDERVKAGAVDGDHEAGVGAELAGAHGEGADEGLAQRGAAGSERVVEQEHRIDGAHLGVDGDRLGACGCGGDECCSAGTGSGEADRFDARIGDEGDAQVLA